jgi:serine/threonine protein kinase
MARPTDPSRDLLFGLLALQNGLIDQVQLVAAFQAWTLDKARSLADHLLALGHLTSGSRTVIESMADLHVAKHGVVERSLAAIAAGPSTHEKLARLGDPDIDGSLAHVRPRSTQRDGEDDADRTATYSVGSATSDGVRFRVLRPHARGGLGAVFVAMDTELHREVALKQILDAHADDEVSRHRFLVEAEITGGLEHPGIVPVYGLGTYGDGRPYYAMRFIRGDSLKEAIERFHADAVLRKDLGKRSLELRKLLRRFTDVCNAIDYAHSCGVLHRDIKPGNVIVGKHGETLVVDWGLAKATGRSDPGSGARTLRPTSASGGAETLPGSALGTPAYMSPEQAKGDLESLGPRSDVYSLGATLYCLLTGQPPFAGDAVDVIPRVQRGDFPPPRALDPSLDRALEAVCMKAMELRPESRYGSCRALAEDIERWMADEPVSARREPLVARARRWARHHRTGVTGAAAALVASLIGLAAVAGVQSRAKSALEMKNVQLTAATAATAAALAATQEEKQKTDAALVQSEEARRRAEAVLGFFKDDVLAAARPEGKAGGLGKDVTVRRAVDQAEPKIAVRFWNQPAVEADVRDTLGSTYYYLGEPALASRQHVRALELYQARLGPEHPDTLQSRHNLAVAYHSAGRTAEAIPLLEATLGLMEAKLGSDHPNTLASRNNLAAAYLTAGRTAEAIKLHEATLKQRALTLGPNHPETLQSRDNLASAYHAAGRTAEAIAPFEATLKMMELSLGPEHPDTLTSRNNLAVAYHAAGRTAEAIPLLEVTLKQRELKIGPEHPDTLQTRNNLAALYHAAGLTAKATSLLEATLKQRESKLGPEHPDTLYSRNNLAAVYLNAGRTAEAIPLFEATLKQRESKLGPEHPDTLNSRGNLAIAYLNAGRTASAIAMHEAGLKLKESKLGSNHPDTLASRNNLASAYRYAGRTSEAINLHEDTLRMRQLKLGPDHPDTLQSRNSLAGDYESLDRWAEAEALRRDALARRRKITRPDSPLLAGDLAPLGRNLLRQSRWLEAEPLLREALAIRARATPEDWARSDAMSLLGGSLLAQGRHAEAEPLVVQGYEGMKAREERIAAPERFRLREAAERVIRLYEACGKLDQATAWKAQLGMPDLPAKVFTRP